MPPDLATEIAAAGIAVCPTLGFDLSALDRPAHAVASRQVAERRPQVRALHRPVSI